MRRAAHTTDAFIADLRLRYDLQAYANSDFLHYLRTTVDNPAVLEILVRDHLFERTLRVLGLSEVDA